jgi:hypothetical protein
MTKSRITFADVGYRGTQLKLVLTLDGQQNVVFKPRWYDDLHNTEDLDASNCLSLSRINKCVLAFSRAPSMIAE